MRLVTLLTALAHERVRAPGALRCGVRVAGIHYADGIPLWLRGFLALPVRTLIRPELKSSSYRPVFALLFLLEALSADFETLFLRFHLKYKGQQPVLRYLNKERVQPHFRRNR